MMNREQLEQRIRQGIPLSAQMDFRVIKLTQNSIQVQGGAKQNINVHGTAFAGSLFTVCTLAAWGLVTSRLPQGASLVMAEAGIRYRKPVIGDLIANCAVSSNDMQSFLQTLNKTGKARLEAKVVVPCDGKPAAEFNGTVYAKITG